MRRLILSLLFGFVCCVQAAKPVEIVFWHSMAGQLGDEVNRLVDEYNSRQKDYQVKAIYKGEYTDSLTSFAAAFRAHKAPAIIQVFEVGTSTMLTPKGIIKPLQQLMVEQNISLPVEDFLPALRSFYSKNNELLAMPFNTSIPVLFYNANALAEIGINANNFPKSWDSLEKVIVQLRERGYRCGYTSAYPAWIQIEAFSALHGLPLTDNSSGKAIYNNPAILHHLQRLHRWQRPHYFEYGGRASDATILFTSGRCLFFSQSSGAYNSLAKVVRFKLGVAALPMDNSISSYRHSNVVGGAALWAVAGQSPTIEKGVARFFAYIAEVKTQRLWQQNTGYIPVGTTGTYASLTISAKPQLSLAQQELSATRSYYSGPQNQIRIINDEALEAVFANIKTPEQALNEAVKRANYLLLRFARNVGGMKRGKGGGVLARKTLITKATGFDIVV